MTDTQKQDYMLRITQANATGLVVILYDMFLDYLAEATAAGKPEGVERSEADGALAAVAPQDGRPGGVDEETYRAAIRNAKAVLGELIGSLHMEYDIARSTYQLYRYVERELVAADLRRDASPLAEVRSIMRRLRDAYAESVKDDDSAPLMQNADTVYAGMTYGPGDVNSGSAAAGTNRGFLA